MRRRQLRIPRMWRETDVVTDRRQVRLVQLDGGVDAIVGESERLLGIVAKSCRGSGRPVRTRQAPVIKGYRDGAVWSDVQVRLELIDRARIVVDEHGRCPGVPRVV